MGRCRIFLSWICFDQVKLLTSKIWRKKGKISAKIGFCFWGGMINRVWILQDRPRGACGPEIAEVWGSGCRHLAGLFYSHLTTTFILLSSRLAADSLEHLQKLLFVMLPAILLSLSSRNFFILIQFSWLITQGVLPSFVISHCIISLYRPTIITLYHYTCHHTKPSQRTVASHSTVTHHCIVTLKIILFISILFTRTITPLFSSLSMPCCICAFSLPTRKRNKETEGRWSVKSKDTDKEMRPEVCRGTQDRFIYWSYF